MALLCKPISGLSTLELFSSLEENAVSASLDLRIINRLLCTEREGTWLHCHTRLNSGWVNADYLEPTTFPAAYVINDELPSDAQIRLRTKPSDDDDVVGKIVSPGSILLVTEIQGNWLRVSVDGTQAWLKRQAGGNILLAVPLIPKLFEKDPSLPRGCQLRVRNAPMEDADVVRLDISDYFLCVQSRGMWVQVLGFPRGPGPEWMLRKTQDGTVLLRESRVARSYMCVEQSLPEEVAVRLRESPDPTANEVFRVCYWDVVLTVGVENAWARVLCDAYEGYMLTVSGDTTILQKYTPRGLAGDN